MATEIKRRNLLLIFNDFTVRREEALPLYNLGIKILFDFIKSHLYGNGKIYAYFRRIICINYLLIFPPFFNY